MSSLTRVERVRRTGSTNADLVAAYWQLKTNIDSGMFEALQEAAAAALRSDQSSVAEMCAIYQRRRDAELSLMAKGVYADAARRSRSIAEGGASGGR